MSTVLNYLAYFMILDMLASEKDMGDFGKGN